MPQYGIGSAIVDGQWLIFAAANAQPSFYTSTEDQDMVPLPEQVTGSVGSWFVTSVLVPADKSAVSASSDGTSFLTLQRPA